MESAPAVQIPFNGASQNPAYGAPRVSAKKSFIIA